MLATEQNGIHQLGLITADTLIKKKKKKKKRKKKKMIIIMLPSSLHCNAWQSIRAAE
jgi:hypothetical protein